MLELIDVNHHMFPPTARELDLVASLGFTWTMFRFTLACLASVPVANLFRLIPSSPNNVLRHVYAITTGFCLLYYPFGAGILHLLVSSSVVYALMVVTPRNCGTLSWVFAMGYLIANHVKQTSGLSWKEGNLDFTGAQMVATLKLISVAVCYQDGWRTRGTTKKVTTTETETAPAQLHAYAAAKKIDVRPSVLEFYSYLLAIGNLLSGPCYEYKDYINYVHRRGDWEKIPSPVVPGTLRFFKALACAGAWMYFYNIMGLNVDFIEGETWRALPFVPRVLSLWGTVVAYRMKYYAVWVVSESMMIFSGFSYKPASKEGGKDATGGTDGKGGTDGSGGTRDDWERYVTSHILSVEFNPSMADVPRHWNICTGRWLRHYVYERMTAVGGKPSFVNMLVTQLVSGVWHGLLPGYWLFFGTSAFIFQASRVIYRYEQGWPSKYRNAYLWWLVKVVVSGTVLNYAGATFVVLEYGESLRIWRSVSYFGHVWMAVVLAIGFVAPPKRRQKQA